MIRLLITILLLPLCGTGQYYLNDSISYTDLGDKMNDSHVKEVRLMLNGDTTGIYRYDPEKRTLIYFRDCLGNEQWRTFYQSGELHSLTYTTRNAEVAEFYEEDGFKHKMISRFDDGRVAEVTRSRDGTKESTVLRDDGTKLWWLSATDADSNHVEQSLHVNPQEDTVYYQKNINGNLIVRSSNTNESMERNYWVDGTLKKGFHITPYDTIHYHGYDDNWDLTYKVTNEIGSQVTVRSTDYFMDVPARVTHWIDDSLTQSIHNHVQLVMKEGQTQLLFYEKRERIQPGIHERYKAVRKFNETQAIASAEDWTTLDTSVIVSEEYFDPSGKRTGYVRLKIRREDTLVIVKDPATGEKRKTMYTGIRPTRTSPPVDIEVPDFPEVPLDPMCGPEPERRRPYQELEAIELDPVQEVDMSQINAPVNIQFELRFSAHTTGLDLADYPCPHRDPAFLYQDQLNHHSEKLGEVLKQYATSVDLSGYRDARLVFRIHFDRQGSYVSSGWVEGADSKWSPFYALGHRSGLYALFEGADPMGEMEVITTAGETVARKIFPGFVEVVIWFE